MVKISLVKVFVQLLLLSINGNITLAFIHGKIGYNDERMTNVSSLFLKFLIEAVVYKSLRNTFYSTFFIFLVINNKIT